MNKCRCCGAEISNFWKFFLDTTNSGYCIVCLDGACIKCKARTAEESAPAHVMGTKQTHHNCPDCGANHELKK